MLLRFFKYGGVLFYFAEIESLLTDVIQEKTSFTCMDTYSRNCLQPDREFCL